MKIICGLGNPGAEYEAHRHNIGFRVIDQVAQALQARFTTTKWEAELATANLGGDPVLLCKPQTFMNRSGFSLAGAARFYKVAVDDVLVVHDELDLPFGTLALKLGGGSGGHNGLNSIHESWGEKQYARLRFGIGKPEGPNAKERVVGHVLGAFSGEERLVLPGLIERAAEGCVTWARVGLAKAMNAFNRRAS